MEDRSYFEDIEFIAQIKLDQLKQCGPIQV